MDAHSPNEEEGRRRDRGKDRRKMEVRREGERM